MQTRSGVLPLEVHACRAHARGMCGLRWGGEQHAGLHMHGCGGDANVVQFCTRMASSAAVVAMLHVCALHGCQPASWRCAVKCVTASSYLRRGNTSVSTNRLGCSGSTHIARLAFFQFSAARWEWTRLALLNAGLPVLWRRQGRQPSR
eukprot:350193-Chlamydomonas_euryale.AAC.12